MQQPQARISAGKVSLTYGLIFGGAISLVDIIYSLILDTANIPLLANLSEFLQSLHNDILFTVLYMLIVGAPIYILLLLSFLFAGVLAARKARKVSAGALAGLWEGGLFFLIDIVIVSILFLFVFTFPSYAHSGVSGSELADFERSTLINSIIYSIAFDVIFIGIGIGISALGGLIGTGSGTKTPPQYYPYQPGQGQPYAPQPQPGQAPPQLYQPHLSQPQPGQMYPDPNPSSQSPGQMPPEGTPPSSS